MTADAHTDVTPRSQVPFGVPIGSKSPSPRPVRPGGGGVLTSPGRRTNDGLLLVGHGSHCRISGVEMRALAGLVADALPDVVVDVGFLEMSEPPAGVVLDRLVAAGCRRVVVQPLVLLGAGHAKSDVPAVVAEGRLRHPGIDIRFASQLGVVRGLVEILGSAVEEAGWHGRPLLLVARGTSDPDANADAYKAARLVAEWTAAPFVQVGFSGVTGPSVLEALDVFARLGHPRMAVAWWFLCHGKLIERARGEITDFIARTEVEVGDAGHIGPDERVVPYVVARYREALAGVATVNCDACAYRAAWPGREDRVGQPVGVGHSHLAAEHRHAGGHSHPAAT